MRVNRNVKRFYRDGNYRWLSWNILPLPDEGIAFAIARDITDKKIADDALKRSGLGLSTVYAISRRHNGFVDMISKPDRGTTISVYLPAVQESETAYEAETQPVSGTVSGGSETKLLAGDDSQVRELARKILERAGYRIYMAGNGEEAIRIFKDYGDQIDLAILDIIMPKRSGYAVYEAMTAVRPDLPVFFCSGYSYTDLEARHLSRKDIHVIQKPYDRNTLLQAVRKALKKIKFTI